MKVKIQGSSVLFHFLGLLITTKSCRKNKIFLDIIFINHGILAAIICKKYFHCYILYNRVFENNLSDMSSGNSVAGPHF